jgi:outer membrane protein TolC
MAGDNDPGYVRLQLGLPLPLLDWKSADRRASSARGKRWVEKSRVEHRLLSAQVRQVAFEQQAQAELAQRYQESAGVIEEGLSYVNRSMDSGEASGMKEVLQLQSRLLAVQKDALKAELDCQRGQIELDRLTGSDP